MSQKVEPLRTDRKRIFTRNVGHRIKAVSSPKNAVESQGTASDRTLRYLSPPLEHESYQEFVSIFSVLCGENLNIRLWGKTPVERFGYS